LDRREGVAEQEASALQGTEQIAEQREAGALDAGEEQGRPTAAVDAALDRPDFESRLDLRRRMRHKLHCRFPVANDCLPCRLPD